MVLPPSARDIDLMEEAFLWPLRHLQGNTRPQISRWAFRSALGLPCGRCNMEKVYLEAGAIVGALKMNGAPVR